MKLLPEIELKVLLNLAYYEDIDLIEPKRFKSLSDNSITGLEPRERFPGEELPASELSGPENRTA